LRAGAPVEHAEEVRLGLIVPSSNTNAESLTAAMLNGTRATAVASRFPLPTSLAAVIDEALIGPAADLVGAAGVSATAFHGTSGSWNGLDGDRALARALHARTGVPTTTASLATVDAVHTLGLERVALLFPGPLELARGIAAEYEREGICVQHCAVPDVPMTNEAISALTYDEISALVRGAWDGSAEAVVCVGTNLRAGYLLDEIEADLGVPVVDSAVATVWALLTAAGADRRLTGWGRLLALG
jgi:maleate isomerase